MDEPLSDEQLAEMERRIEGGTTTPDDFRDLLAEVRRLRAMERDYCDTLALAREMGFQSGKDIGRAAALEEAAKVAEDMSVLAGIEIAAAIRALKTKEKP